MALPNSGPLSLNQIHVEAGGSSGSQASINDSDIRGLIGKSSGAQMSFNEWYGASAEVNISQTISSSTNNYVLTSNRGGSYSPGITNYTLTINPGVTVGTNSPNGYSLSTGNAWTSGDTIRINNYGSIKGAGGPGGTASSAPGGMGGSGNSGTAGTSINGAAVQLSYATTIANYGSIYGGGGGGGSGGARKFVGASGKLQATHGSAGGGGGGGAGVNAGGGGPSGFVFLANNVPNQQSEAGSAGSANAGGAGGRGAKYDGFNFTYQGQNAGGAGGGLGSNGATGGPAPPLPPPAGISNYANVTVYNGNASGTRGYYISGGNSATWAPTGTRAGRTS